MLNNYLHITYFSITRHFDIFYFIIITVSCDIHYLISSERFRENEKPLGLKVRFCGDRACNNTIHKAKPICYGLTVDGSGCVHKNGEERIMLWFKFEWTRCVGGKVTSKKGLMLQEIVNLADRPWYYGSPRKGIQGTLELILFKTKGSIGVF